MGADAIAALATAIALILTAIGGVIAAIATLIGALRKKDTAPAPQVGITATPPVGDDIDYRAYADAVARAERAEKDRDVWMRRALGDVAHLDEDTQPLDPT